MTHIQSLLTCSDTSLRAFDKRRRRRATSSLGWKLGEVGHFWPTWLGARVSSLCPEADQLSVTRFIEHSHNVLLRCVMTASMTQSFASWTLSFPPWIQGTSVNRTVEICMHYFTHNLRMVLRHGHGTSANSVRLRPGVGDRANTLGCTRKSNTATFFFVPRGRSTQSYGEKRTRPRRDPDPPLHTVLTAGSQYGAAAASLSCTHA